MIRFSTRYLPHIALILALTLVPVSIHSYAKVRTPDRADWGRAVEGLSASAPAPENARMKEIFDASMWARGPIEADSRGTMSFTIVQSYDAKRVYHFPELTLLFPHGRLDRDFLAQIPRPRTVDWVNASAGRIPIHRISFQDSTRDRITAGAYLLVYRGVPVEHPYAAQIQAALPQMFVGRSPMTLYFVSSAGPSAEESRMQATATEWLVAAWRQYARACGK